MTDVFISYSSNDRERVKPLVEKLQSLGLDIWWDRDIGGGSLFDREIEAAIDSAKCVVVVWSEHSVDSDWVRTEATEGMDRNILVPVQIDDVRPPLAFRRTQTAQLLGWPDKQNQEELTRFLTSVRIAVKAPDASATSLLGTSERRTITHLTARILGLEALHDSIELEEIEDVVEQIRTACSKVITRNGGTINQFTGKKVHALFGLPIAHEDDPVRAVLAGIELNKHLKEHMGVWRDNNLAFSIGIATGLVVAKIKHGTEGKYGLTGACIDLSNDLADQTSGNSVLVCERTQRRAPGFFELQKRDDITVRGKSGPVTGFLVLDRTNVYTRFQAAESSGLSEFCGRELEMTMAAQIKAQVMMGEGHVLSVVGEAGSGKSRFLHEFEQGLDDDETLLLTGQCQSNGAESAYLPFIDLLREAFDLRGVHNPDLEDHVVNRILELDPALEPYIPYCLNILSIPSDTHRLPPDLEADSKRLALQESLVALLTATTQVRPTVLVLEDWHWADEASNVVLQKLVDISMSYPFFLIVSHRPVYQPSWSQNLNCSQLKIAPLNQAASLSVMRSVIDAVEIPGSFGKLIYDRTGGNPFFIEEICKSLVEDGVVSVVEGEMILHRDLETLEIPDTVQAVIRARLDQLDPLSNEVLCTAAIIGREFSINLLQEVTGKISSVRMVLGMLAGAGLIAQIRTLPEPLYIFRHVLIQNVAYDSMLLKQRKKLHEKAGNAIETMYAERLDDYLEKLVYHFVNSDDRDKAIEYSIRSGKKAASQSACHEAVSHFTRALGLLEKQSDSEEIAKRRFEIHLELAQQLIPTDGYASQRVLDAFDTARELNRQVGDPQRFFPTLWGLWRLNYVKSQYESALALSRELMDMATEIEDSNYLSAAHTAESVSHYWLGNLPKVIEHSDKAIELQDLEYENKFGYRYSVQPAVMNLCFRQSALFAMGRHDEARETRQKLARMTQDVNHAPTEIFSLFYRGVSYSFEYNVEAASEVFRQVEEISIKQHFPYLTSLARFHLARLLIWMGRFDEAIEGMSTHQKELEAMGLSVSSGLYHLTVAALCYQKGSVKDGLEHIDKAMNTLPFLDAEIHRVKADLLSLQDVEGAIEWYRKALQISHRQGARFFELKAACGLAMLHLKMGRPGPAVETLEEICDGFPADNTAPELQNARKVLAQAKEQSP